MKTVAVLYEACVIGTKPLTSTIREIMRMLDSIWVYGCTGLIKFIAFLNTSEGAIVMLGVFACWPLIAGIRMIVGK
jgi:hypothetical protein